MPCIPCFHMGMKSMETALAAAHRDSGQGLSMHHLAWLEDDAPRWSLSLVATMPCATKPCQGSEHLVPAETGSWGHLEPCDPCQKARSPQLHCVRMGPMHKSSGINTLWLPPVSNQSLQRETGQSQQSCPLQPHVPPQRMHRPWDTLSPCQDQQGQPPTPNSVQLPPKSAPELGSSCPSKPRSALAAASVGASLLQHICVHHGGILVGDLWEEPVSAGMVCPMLLWHKMSHRHCLCRAWSFWCFPRQGCGWTTHTSAS